MSDGYRVYWAPGCSSCLRTKEFLASRNIPFQSVNIHEEPEALQDLAKLGFRSIPVVAKGDRGVLCQELSQVAEFVGVPLAQLDQTQLSPDEFFTKIDLVLHAAARFSKQLSDEQLARNFSGRKNRNFRGLAAHIAIVVEGFLNACRGGTLDFEYYIHEPPEDVVSGAQLAEFINGIRLQVKAWWEENGELPETLKTYWGERPHIGVIERTTWHSAQHCRQLQSALELLGVTPDGPLGDAELAGLPLPENIFDNELAMGTEASAEAEAKAKMKELMEQTPRIDPSGDQ